MKIRRAQIQDAEFIISVLKHPSSELSNDDGIFGLTSDNVELFLQSEMVHCLISSTDKDMGFFLFIKVNHVTVELHTNILPECRGKQVIKASELAIEYVWDQGFKKIVTQVPVFNKAALLMSLSCGMIKEGINKKSFMKNGTLYDQYYLGFYKD
jgi:hypothetical protein